MIREIMYIVGVKDTMKMVEILLDNEYQVLVILDSYQAQMKPENRQYIIEYTNPESSYKRFELVEEKE